MNRLAAAALILACAFPLAANAAQPLAASQSQRQHILDLEYDLNQPGQTAANAQSIQNQITAIETQILTSDVPPMAVPVYGSCDADNAVLAYLQDQVQNGNLDAQTLYTYKRNIYDLGVNLRQRGC